MLQDNTLLISRPFGLYEIFLSRLREISYPDKYIEWKKLYEKQCRLFSLKKQDVRKLIFLLKDHNYLKVSPRGVLLNLEVLNGN